MRINPHRNLTVTLLRRNQFSALRYAGSFPRRSVAQAIHIAQYLKHCPPVNAATPQIGPPSCAEAQPQQAWPYDTPQPTGLARLPEKPTAAGADNYMPGPKLPQIAIIPHRPADAKGTRLDVLA